MCLRRNNSFVQEKGSSWEIFHWGSVRNVAVLWIMAGQQAGKLLPKYGFNGVRVLVPFILQVIWHVG